MIGKIAFAPLVVAVWLGVAPVASGQVFPGPYSGTVSNVVDGDTFEAQVEIWPNVVATVSVRVRGIDAPETRGHACEEEARFSDEATAVLEQELYEANPEGRIELDNVEDDVWSGRIVADVYRPNVERRTPLKEQLLRRETVVEWTPGMDDVPWNALLCAGDSE